MVALKPATVWASPSSKARSRNAVVALKPRGSMRRTSSTFSKQERRGGIETLKSRRWKMAEFKEAGTPWWH